MVVRLNLLLLIHLAVSMILTGCTTNQRNDLTDIRKEADIVTPIVAKVNGQVITRDQLLASLLPAYGREVLDELVLLEIVRQHAKSKGIAVTDDSAAKQYERMLKDIAPDKPRSQQEAMFEYMLKKRGVSRAVFDLILQRQGLLRQMVDTDVTVSQKMIADEYQRQHSKRIVVRQLVVSSFRAVEQAQKKLRAGQSFSKIVQDTSEDQTTLARGGLIGPFSIADNYINPEVRKTAFELKEIGQRSKIFSYKDKDGSQWWYMLQLERVTPSDNAVLTEVKNELIKIIKQRTIRQRMLDLQNELKAKASIIITGDKITK